MTTGIRYTAEFYAASDSAGLETRVVVRSNVPLPNIEHANFGAALKALGADLPDECEWRPMTDEEIAAYLDLEATR